MLCSQGSQQHGLHASTRFFKRERNNLLRRQRLSRSPTDHIRAGIQALCDGCRRLFQDLAHMRFKLPANDLEQSFGGAEQLDSSPCNSGVVRVGSVNCAGASQTRAMRSDAANDPNSGT